MGVYIPNVKFPQNCDECDLLYDCCACGVTHKRMDFETMDRVRNPHCPLVPVPPHGRLIDASEKIRVQIYDDMAEDFHMVDMTIDDLLSQGWIEANAPTIIPAEEGEA